MREYLEAVRQHSSLEMAICQRDMESMLRDGGRIISSISFMCSAVALMTLNWN